MIYDKPYKNTQELITILESRNLNFNNMGFASDILNTVGYYDLINAYKQYFYKNLDPEEYKDGLNFEYLYAFYYIDKDFQNVLLNAILLVENIFKNRISQVISQKYGVDKSQYLATKVFQNISIKINNKKVHSNTFIRDIYNEKVNSPNKCDAITHYKNNHNHIPPWILFKDFTFMEIINFYRFLNKNDQQEIAELMIKTNIPANKKVGLLKKMLHVLRKSRNTIAHNNLFIGKNHKIDITNTEINTMLPPVLKIVSGYQNSKYYLICFIVILLDVDILKRYFIAKIRRMIAYNEKSVSSVDILNKYYKYLGLPSDFTIIIENYFNELNNKNSELIKGNKRRKIYHLQNGIYYNQLAASNTIYFKDEKEAISYGYRKSKK